MHVRTCLAGVLLASLTLQLSATDYLSEGGDPARTGWIQDEKVFSRANVTDTRLLWKRGTS